MEVLEHQQVEALGHCLLPLEVGCDILCDFFGVELLSDHVAVGQAADGIFRKVLLVAI